MPQSNPLYDRLYDRSRLARKAVVIELLRELASTLAALADIMDKSPICSGDWLAAQLHSALAACAFWQRRAGEYLRSWDIEDFEQQRELPPDL
jgi:primosomal protein N''